ncbi:glycerophosphodiester phosphodiesterase family protein [Rhizobiaceae bacterium]|nr:glycerophosphodiester phosphodiesterase family protein [Rhizobiaceae bacterium]
MIRSTTLTALLLAVATPAIADGISLGERPAWLVSKMEDSPLKTKLEACIGKPASTTAWSIGHRGAPLLFPEHTAEGYRAAAAMGAGIVECDVTFTKDKQLVCRHAQNDLHTTTNILATPLASQCTAGFKPAAGEEGASAECRASDITLAEFRTLEGKMDAADATATEISAYMDGTASFRTDLYSPGTPVTHAESIELLKGLDVRFTPELKSPSVEMPYEGMSQGDYAQAMIDEYKAAGVSPADVYPQSFNLDDVLYWIENEPEFGKQAVYLDDSYDIEGWSPEDESTWPDTMASLKERGVNIIAPPLWVLVKVEDGKLAPSLYATKAKEAGLEIIAWSLERSGKLTEGGGWYYQTSNAITKNEGDVFEMLDALNTQVGVKGVFSDWPATTTFYANCMGLK